MTATRDRATYQDRVQAVYDAEITSAPEICYLAALTFQTKEFREALIAGMHEAAFTDYRRALIFRAICALHLEGREFNNLIIVAWLESAGLLGEAGGAKYVSDLLINENAEPFHADEYRRAILDTSEKRARIHALEDALSAERNGGLTDILRRRLIEVATPREAESEQESVAAPQIDHGEPPIELLFVPGFMADLMAYTLATAPRPNSVCAFAGALAMLSFITGRKVKNSSGLRTNLYILALAGSGAGEEHPRQVNTQVANAIGAGAQLGNSFASGEGLEDAIAAQSPANPCMFFQPDEIGTILAAIAKGKEPRFEKLKSTLLQIHSCAGNVYPMRTRAIRAGHPPPPSQIVQPHLTMLGTATPANYYQSLSPDVLENGLQARMLAFEAGRRGEFNENAGLKDKLPDSVFSFAKYWHELKTNEMVVAASGEPPKLRELKLTDAGLLAAREARSAFDANWKAAADMGDRCGQALWTRADEHTAKLAMLHALSADREAITISDKAIRWASELVTFSLRRTLAMAHRHTADNPFHAMCQKALNILETWHQNTGGKAMPFSKFTERCRLSPKDLSAVIEWLEQTGRAKNESTIGRGGQGKKLRFVPIVLDSFHGEKNEQNSCKGL